jgi:uncharacterized protein YjdB
MVARRTAPLVLALAVAAALLACNTSALFIVVQVNPDSLTLVVGGQDTLRAQATELGYGVVQNAPISWSSNDTAVATVEGDSVAVVTGVGVGSTEILATSGGSIGTVPVTVTAPVPAPVAAPQHR